MTPTPAIALAPRRHGASFFAKFLVAGLLAVFAAAALRAGFAVQNGALYDSNGNRFVMRGLSHPHVWYTSQTASAIPAIAATGANSVRLVLGNGRQWGPTPQAELASLIALCKANKLIAVPEVHDCTGYGDTGGYAPNAAPLATAVDYWIGVKAALDGQENYVIINIANEPFGNGVSASTYVNEFKTAISRLRAAGFTHTLMVDAANWGQDWEGLLLNHAAEIFNADPLRNTIFSVHMYEVYQQDSTINSYMATFQADGLALVVGEFAATHGSNDVNEASIMQRAQERGIGYLGWSWSGNGSGLEALDIVQNFNPAARTAWGNTLITGANGLSTTSAICSVFNTTTTLTLSPTALSLTAAASSGTVAVSSNASWTVSDDQSWLTTSAAGGSGNGSFTIAAAANTGTAARSGTVTVTAGSVSKTVTVAQAGVSTTTLAVSPTTVSLAGTAGTATVAVTASGSWTVSDNADWLSTSVTSGSGNGSFSLAATANSASTARSGTVTVTSGGTSRTVSVSQAAGTTDSTNIALGKPVVVSSVESSSLAGSYAVDGNAASRWSSAYSDPQWLYVDLGGTYDVSRVVLNWETAYASGYRIEISSDAANWTQLYSTTSGNGGSDDLAVSGRGRYVRLYGTARATVWGYSLWEFQVFGKVADTPAVPVTGVAVSPTSTSVSVGSSVTLAATVAPANATNKAVTWTSANPAVATVNGSGVVTGVAIGSTIVTVRTADGSFSATSTVTVTSTGGSTPTPITVPFVKEGAGDFYYVFSGSFQHINSWNLDVLTINGVSYKGQWVTALPPAADGKYVVHYVASVGWGHFEVK